MLYPFQACRDHWVKATRRPESDLYPEAMESIGIRNLIRLAKGYNHLRFGSRQRMRRRLYREAFDHLIEENGPLATPPPSMKDGWVIDDTMTLPHLDRVLAEAEAYMAEYGGRPRQKGVRGFIQDILRQEELARFTSFLDFATSSPLLTTVADYLGMVPVLSDTVPPGVRFVESTSAGQMDDGIYRQSQLYHLDFHDSPLVYVIVLLRDVTVRSGPFTFLSASTSARVAQTLGYLKRGSPYRLRDDQVYPLINRQKEEVVFTYPRGTVLFMDSSRCMHFGSRDAEVTRYQLMLAYVSACRGDFADQYLQPRVFPVRDSDSRLRRLVLDAAYRI